MGKHKRGRRQRPVRNLVMNGFKGFTLVELLVVIAVVGVLMGVSVAFLNPAAFFGRGRDSRRLSDLGQIRTALELDFADQNQYASDLPDLVSRFPTISTTDPDGVTTYRYCPDTSDYMSYDVCTNFEIIDHLTIDTCSVGIGSTAPTGCGGMECCLTNPF